MYSRKVSTQSDTYPNHISSGDAEVTENWVGKTSKTKSAASQ